MPTPVGFAEIAVEYRHANDPEPWYNVFGVATDLSSFSAQETLDHVAGVWFATVRPRLSTAVTMTNATGRFGQDGGADIIIETTVAPLAGQNSDAMLPQNCALLVRKQTSLGGRHGRGRIFMPAMLAEAGVSDTGIIASGDLAIFQTLVDDLLDDLAAADPVSGATAPMVLLHGPGKATGVTPAPTPVETLVVDSVIATQRQRLRK